MYIAYKIFNWIMSLFIALMPLKISASVSSVSVCDEFTVKDSIITLSFAKAKVNTVTIEFEEAADITLEIVSGDSVIYTRRGSEAFRYCAFRTIETEKLEIRLSKECRVKAVSAKYNSRQADDFRVTAYVVASSISESNKPTANSFDVITDVILFGCAVFDENGNLHPDENLITESLSLLREAIGQRKVNIYINLLGPDNDKGISDWNEQMNNKAAKHNKAFKNKALIENIIALAGKYNFDGIFFDYEYPLEKDDCTRFDYFLNQLDRKTDKLIGVAVSDWDMYLNYSSLKAVDMAELMMYDRFDEIGNHSSFMTAVNGLNAVKNAKYPLQKVDLGVPFYGRPSDSAAYWPAYKDYAAALGTSYDGAETENGFSYFNCAQTIYDKTAYALDNGFGGMMVWHYACDITDTDNGLSLFGAMKACISDREV